MISATRRPEESSRRCDYIEWVADSQSSANDSLAEDEELNGALTPDRLFRSNLSEQIAVRLRDDIVHGRIPAGTHLVQDDLCERFGTSRMPVRDALQQLTHEGLVEQRGQQRIVMSLGADELEETYLLVGVLHGWAAGRAAVKASDAEIEELGAICRSAMETEDPYDFGLVSMQFHRQINLMAHSPRLIRTLVGFQQSVPRAVPFNDPRAVEPGNDEHRAIVAAITARDAELAERLTRDHAMKMTVDLLMESLQAGRRH
jgi:DNA-binding GntR family transcriptional regulator